MKTNRIVLGFICFSTLGLAASNQKTPEAGVVQAPSAGTKELSLQELPATIRHAADVALSGLGASFSLTGAVLDLDDVLATYEVQATLGDGRRVEVDVEPSGRIEEMEIQINREEIPASVLEALSRHASGFQQAQEGVMYEKSLRPSANGLVEVWYEFSGTTFDVEIRSDAKKVLIEPA